MEALQGAMEVKSPVNILSHGKQRPRRAKSAQTKGTPPEKHDPNKQTCYRYTGQHYCQKHGHLKKVYKKRLRETQGSQAFVNNLFDDQESSGDEMPGMYHTTTVYSTASPAKTKKPLCVSLQLDIGFKGVYYKTSENAY